MKLFLTVVALTLSGLSAWAQVLAPSGPVLSPNPSPVLSPTRPVVAPGPVMPPVAQPPPRPGSTPADIIATNPGVADQDLRGVLLNMQAVLEQTIPPLIAHTASVDPGVVTNNFAQTNIGPLALQPPQPQPAPSGQNLSSVAGANLSSRAGANHSGNLSSVVGASPAVTMPSVPAGSSAAPNTSTSGISQPANGALPVATARETLRALLVLQQDLDRALVLVDAINASPTVPEVFLPPTGR